MQEYNFDYINDINDIKGALQRNKRLGIDRLRSNYSEELETDDYSKFLEYFVFTKLGMTPSQLVGNLETQYYAEQDWRDRRQRNVEFTRGRQFGEQVWDNELKRYVTMWTYLRRRGLPPLTYNVVSKLVRSLEGQFREINTGNVVRCESKSDRGTEIAAVLTRALDRVKKKNKHKQSDASNFVETLISGRPVFKVMWGSKNNITKPDVKMRTPISSKFMINPGVVDLDLDNLYMGTQIHDTTLDDIVGDFSKGDHKRGAQIRQGYTKYQGNERAKSSYSSQSFDGQQLRNNTFHYQGIGNSAYRYYETWYKVSDYEAITYDPLAPLELQRVCHKLKSIESVEKWVNEENEKRKNLAQDLDPEEDIYVRIDATEFVSRFYVIYMTPWHMVLDVRESPFKHGQMPFVFTPPGMNGEVWGLVEEVLNAQKSLDRQILNADSIVANASKGVWFVPDTAVPDDMTNKEFLSEVKKADGAIIYKVKEGADFEHKPYQQYANSANVGNQVQQLIQMYSGLVDEISGNYGAAQGKSTSSSTTATGYALESQNAGLNIRGTIESYLSTLVSRDELAVNLIKEGYTKKDYMDLFGIELDPMEIAQYEFSIEQSKGTNSPAHRLALEQELLNLVQAELIPFEVFLDISNNPVMIQAKQKLEEYNKKMADQQMMAEASSGGGQAPNANMNIPEGEMLSAQGHPQMAMLKEQPIEQQMPKLPGIA